jgi:nucleoside-diphosphate-sugar epimerase
MRKTLATSVFLRGILKGVPIEIHGSGEQTRCYTHVDDISSGIRAVLENRSAPRVVNVSDETPYSVNQLVAVISYITKKEPIYTLVDDREGQIKSSVINSKRLQKLGWKPKWSLTSGLENCLGELE